MNRQEFLDLPQKSKTNHIEKLYKIYDKLSVWELSCILEMMIQYGDIYTNQNEIIRFTEIDNRLHVTKTYKLPNAEVGKNNWINGFKFNILDNDEESN